VRARFGDVPRFKETLASFILRWNLLIVLAAVIGGFAIRTYGALNWPLDKDETFFLSYGRLMIHGWSPFGNFQEIGVHMSSYIIYLYSLSSFMKAFGPGIFQGRMLSVAASTVTIAVLYFIGRDLFNKTVGCLSSVVFAFSPFTIRFGYLALSDSLQIMFISLTIYTLVYAVKNHKSWPFALNGFFLVMAVFTTRSAMIMFFTELGFLALAYTVLAEDDTPWLSRLKEITKNIVLFLVGASIPIGLILHNLSGSGSPWDYFDMVYNTNILGSRGNIAVNVSYLGYYGIVLLWGVALFVTLTVRESIHPRLRIWLYAMAGWAAIMLLDLFLFKLLQPYYHPDKSVDMAFFNTLLIGGVVGIGAGFFAHRMGIGGKSHIQIPETMMALGIVAAAAVWGAGATFKFTENGGLMDPAYTESLYLMLILFFLAMISMVFVSMPRERFRMGGHILKSVYLALIMAFLSAFVVGMLRENAEIAYLMIDALRISLGLGALAGLGMSLTIMAMGLSSKVRRWAEEVELSLTEGVSVPICLMMVGWLVLYSLGGGIGWGPKSLSGWDLSTIAVTVGLAVFGIRRVILWVDGMPKGNLATVILAIVMFICSLLIVIGDPLGIFGYTMPMDGINSMPVFDALRGGEDGFVYLALAGASGILVTLTLMENDTRVNDTRVNDTQGKCPQRTNVLSVRTPGKRAGLFFKARPFLLLMVFLFLLSIFGYFAVSLIPGGTGGFYHRESYAANTRWAILVTMGFCLLGFFWVYLRGQRQNFLRRNPRFTIPLYLIVGIAGGGLFFAMTHFLMAPGNEYMLPYSAYFMFLPLTLLAGVVLVKGFPLPRSTRFSLIILVFWLFSILVLYLNYTGLRLVHFYELSVPASVMAAAVAVALYRGSNRTVRSVVVPKDAREPIGVNPSPFTGETVDLESRPTGGNRFGIHPEGPDRLNGPSGSPIPLRPDRPKRQLMENVARDSGPRPFAYISIFALILLLLSAPLSQVFFARDEYFTSQIEDTRPRAQQIIETGRYLREHTQEGEYIFGWPMYAMEADRFMIYNITYATAYSGALGSVEEFGYPSEREIMYFLSQNNVRYFVFDTNIKIYWLIKPRLQYFSLSSGSAADGLRESKVSGELRSAFDIKGFDLVSDPHLEPLGDDKWNLWSGYMIFRIELKDDSLVVYRPHLWDFLDYKFPDLVWTYDQEDPDTERIDTKVWIYTNYTVQDQWYQKQLTE